MKAAIVDDEPLARARIKRLLLAQSVEVIAEGKNGFDAVEIATDEAIDILFIDINMPGKNGLEAVQEIDDLVTQPPAIVFCTAYDEYAVEAFSTNAVAYLLKPFSEEELLNAMEKAQTLSRVQVNKLSQQPGSGRSLLAGGSGELIKLDLNEVAYFYSKDKHIYAKLYDDSEAFVDNSLKQLEIDLSDTFVRIHRNTLVNVEAIKRVYKSETGSSLLELKQIDVVLSISRRHLSGVKKCIV